MESICKYKSKGKLNQKEFYSFSKNFPEVVKKKLRSIIIKVANHCLRKKPISTYGDNHYWQIAFSHH